MPAAVSVMYYNYKPQVNTTHTVVAIGAIGEYTIAGLDRWTGLVDWTGGLETCSGENVVNLC